jgi:hypothetical protein
VPEHAESLPKRIEAFMRLGQMIKRAEQQGHIERRVLVSELSRIAYLRGSNLGYRASALYVNGHKINQVSLVSERTEPGSVCSRAPPMSRILPGAAGRWRSMSSCVRANSS